MNEKELLTLGIETSCDETSVAVVRGGREILSNVISSQIEIHKVFGGVVPEIASRHHLDNMNPVIAEALETAGVTFADIDVVGVTKGPGLVGALLIGIASAKAIAYASKKPLVGVHHIHGHICANYLAHPQLEPPFLALVVSGGHTNLIDVKSYDEYEVLGGTRDDAVGEAFDKVARVLGLGYPGGPNVDKLAREGNPAAIPFKRVYLEKDSLDFSFSGIKTAVINYIHTQEQKKEAINPADVAASFQMAVMDVIVDKSIYAARQTGNHKIVMAGGVAANSMLREKMEQAAKNNNMELYYPPLILCTDNAAMIACAAHYRYKAGEVSGLDLDAYPGLKI